MQVDQGLLDLFHSIHDQGATGGNWLLDGCTGHQYEAGEC
jgi:hypothetical protein